MSTPLPFVLKGRVKKYIEDHLHDPALNVPQIAHALNCSTRYLHMLFRDESFTLSQYIQDLRLQRAYGELTAASRPETTITDLSMKWGFSTPSHFSRLFRRKYGCPARELRVRYPSRLS
jgi:AraC-like DNA-binding protein